MTKKTENKKPSVLVLGEDTRSFLSVVRSLGQAGYEVHVVCYDQTSPALKSKYIQTAQFYNYQAYTQEEWLDNVEALIERYQFDLVVPCDERAIYPLWSARNRIPSHTKLAIANQEGLDALFDKWKTKQAAIACDVPVAKGHTVKLSTSGYQELKDEFGDNFVVKPLQSFEQSKLNQRQKVAIIKSEKDFADYTKYIPENQDYLIEAFFSGKGEGLSVLSIDGKLYAAFAHVRVAEPKSGGGSSYRMSVPVDDELLKATEAVCAHTNLTGVAMFEFRRNLTTNKWILVEVNARYWGSLPLAVFAGVDFPRLYADYQVKGQKPEQPVLSYRNQVCARALIADIYEIKRELEITTEEEGMSKALANFSLRLLKILKAVTPAETIDSFHFKDQHPFYAEVNLLCKSLMASFIRKSSLLARFRRYRTKRSLKKLFAINKNRRILFICYGNIMRSSFAEKYVKQRCCDNLFNLDFDSFGFHIDEQRSSPDNAKLAAQELSCDLSNHSSKWLTQLDLRDSDILIYFDDKNRDNLASYYKVNHAFCAADLLDNTYPKASEIADPYGGDVSGVVACYRQIECSVDHLLKLYREATQ